MTIGSDIYLLLNPNVRHRLEAMNHLPPQYMHGTFHGVNGSSTIDFNATFAISNATMSLHMLKGTIPPIICERCPSSLRTGCYREPEWPWWRQPFPFWTLFFLVPVYSLCSSLSNLQSYRSWRILVMVFFSCCSFAANKAANGFLGQSVDISSAAGALAIGLLGNIYSRVTGGTAFTAMVTGVLFLVPVRVFTNSFTVRVIVLMTLF